MVQKPEILIYSDRNMLMLMLRLWVLLDLGLSYRNDRFHVDIIKHKNKQQGPSKHTIMTLHRFRGLKTPVSSLKTICFEDQIKC